MTHLKKSRKKKLKLFFGSLNFSLKNFSRWFFSSLIWLMDYHHPSSVPMIHKYQQPSKCIKTQPNVTNLSTKIFQTNKNRIQEDTKKVKPVHSNGKERIGIIMFGHLM